MFNQSVMLRRFFLKLTLNIFPPLFFNRIYLKNISADYREMNVSLKRSFTNINYYKSIFGGSIFSACDPFFPIMYYHIFKEKKLIGVDQLYAKILTIIFPWCCLSMGQHTKQFFYIHMFFHLDTLTYKNFLLHHGRLI